MFSAPRLSTVTSASGTLQRSRRYVHSLFQCTKLSSPLITFILAGGGHSRCAGCSAYVVAGCCCSCCSWWPYRIGNGSCAFLLNITIATVIKRAGAMAFILFGLVKDIVIVCTASYLTNYTEVASNIMVDLVPLDGIQCRTLLGVQAIQCRTLLALDAIQCRTLLALEAIQCSRWQLAVGWLSWTAASGNLHWACSVEWTRMAARGNPHWACSAE